MDELVLHNSAYLVAGFARDIEQPALVNGRSRGIPVGIGILDEKVRRAQERGHGVIYFYWEGLWELHAGPAPPPPPLPPMP